MRFQTHEAVAVQDTEIVLQALETCLRDVSPEVVRYGDQITLHGLGPSPKAVNYQDTTVLSVSAEDDKTIINADVNFQASSILGDVPQDAVVRSKLDQVFDQMRTQIGLEPKRSAAAEAGPHVKEEASSPAPDVETAGNFSAASASFEPLGRSDTFAAMAGSASAAPVSLLEESQEPEVRYEAPAPAPMPADVDDSWHRDDEDAALVAMLRREIQLDEPDDDSSGPWKWVLAIIVVLLLVAGGVYLWQTGRLRVPSRLAAVFSHSSVAPTATTAASSPAAPESAAPANNNAPTAPAPAASAPPSTAASTPPAAAVAPPNATAAPAAAATPSGNVAPAKSTALANANVPDPKVWLERWAAAMQSRDPVAQASFYADPVSQYINQRNVSNAVLANEKRADIGRRHGVWTFGANDIVVENRTPTDATVQLVKHYMIETGPSQQSEIFVKTHMQLKVVDGQWKITSEEELRSPTRASINPIDR